MDLGLDENLKKLIEAPSDKVRDGLASILYGKTWKEIRYELSSKIKCGILTSADFFVKSMQTNTYDDNTQYTFCLAMQRFDQDLIRVLQMIDGGIEVSDIKMGQFPFSQMSYQCPELTLTIYDSELPGDVLKTVMNKIYNR